MATVNYCYITGYITMNGKEFREFQQRLQILLPSEKKKLHTGQAVA